MDIKFRIVALYYNYRYEITTVQQTGVPKGIIREPLEFDTYSDAENWLDNNAKRNTVYQIQKVHMKP